MSEQQREPDMWSLRDIQGFFRGAFPSNLKVMRELYGLKVLQIHPPSTSPFSLNVDGVDIPLFLPADDFIGLPAFLNQSYDINKVNFFVSRSSKLKSSVILLDIGANVGLFSRQLASQLKDIKQAFLFEPHPKNYELLEKNIKDWRIEKYLINKGISDETGRLEFYEDPANCGNYSLNISAMPISYNTIEVDVIAASEFEPELLKGGLPIFYKSDTQGFDEKIASGFSFEFWDRVDSAVFELWRIKKPTFDVDKFKAVLDMFPNKVFEKRMNVNLNTEGVIEYLSANDGLFDDLWCWK
jgi:FkbM family methyltransferase